MCFSYEISKKRRSENTKSFSLLRLLKSNFKKREENKKEETKSPLSNSLAPCAAAKQNAAYTFFVNTHDRHKERALKRRP